MMVIAMITMGMMALTTCRGQLFKVKNDNTCSTKMASKHRVHSLLISSRISQTLSNIASSMDCQKRCNEDSVCKYAGHNQATKACFFFKENLVHETISRLIFEGWTYGRINSDKKLLVYATTASCNEDFCRESCLSAVEEKCALTEYEFPRCIIPTVHFSSCVAAREYVSTNPSPGISTSSHLDETTDVHLNIDGYRMMKSCPADVEYTTIRDAHGRALEFFWGLYYVNTADYYSVRAYNKVTGYLTDLNGKQLGLSDYSYYWSPKYKLLNTYGTPQPVIITPYGTMQLKTSGRQCFVTGWINNNNRFYLEDNVCFKQSNEANQLKFTNIKGAIRFSHYDVRADNNIEQFLEHANYPDNPTVTGTLINFEAAYNIKEHFCIRMQVLFVAPGDGPYVFSAISDDFSRTYLSTDHTESNKQPIIDITGHTSSFVNAASKELVSGKKYYLEMVGCDIGGDDFFKVAVKLPDGTFVDPITYKYLEPVQ